MSEAEKVERVVRGGATMFPRESPRPKPLELSEVMKGFLVPGIRGPLLAIMVTKACHPYYVRWLKSFLERGGTEAAAFANGITAVHTSIYLSMFAFFEIFGKYDWLHQYQLPRTPAQEPTFKMKMRVLFEFFVSTIWNHFFILPHAHSLFKRMGMPDGLSPLPSFLKMFGHFCFANIFNMIGFGLVHCVNPLFS